MKSFDQNMLDAFLDEYYAQNQNSGYLRVTHKDEILYEKNMGFADRENQVPFISDSMFTFYSLSKPFCALGLLRLQDKGLVDIDQHPSKYVPEAAGFDARVTLRHMLHHVSGLPDFVKDAKFNEKYPSGQPRELREQLKELAQYPMLFQPGTSAMYANINFIISALTIENISGMSYPEYMQKEVFAPLGMATAKVDGPGVEIEHRVQGYELEDGKVVPAQRSFNWMLGAGDLIGTADDVYCLNKAIKQQSLLKPETWAQVLTPSPINSMGMGCTIVRWHGKLRIRHNGGSKGFRTMHIQLPEDDFDIIYLSNSGWGKARQELSEAVYGAFYGKDDSVQRDVQMDAGYI